MKPLDFGISVQVENRTGNIIAVYFQVRKGKAAAVREFANGNAFANYASNGQLLGVEVLGPCHITVLDRIASKEPKVRSFIRRSIPRDLALVE